MNKMLNSDIYRRQVDNRATSNILKYYQSTVFIPEFKDIEYQDTKILGIPEEAIYYDLPESIIEEYDVNKLNDKVKVIIECLAECIKKIEHNSILPIITIFNWDDLLPGFYALDIVTSKLLCYKKLIDFPYEKIGVDTECKLSISYFVDLYRCAYYSGEYGFIEGIMNIGVLKNEISRALLNLNCSDEILRMPQQVLTHAIGINGREQLLILNQFIK